MKHAPKRIVLTLLGFGMTMILLIPLMILQFGKAQIYTDLAKIPHHTIGIVFGAAVNRDKTPSDILKDRLQTAADLYNQKIIDRILVSGDNRVEDYNEPESMYAYLVENFNIPEKDIIKDSAGLRTYDTCMRAKTVLNIDQALLITQGYHLPRALFTCNALGVKSEGFSASKRDYKLERKFKIREILALYKAFWDVYINTPDYIE